MMGPGEGVSVSATPSYSVSVSEFTPTPGGPFSALTPSMWPQDILSRLGNPVCIEKNNISKLITTDSLGLLKFTVGPVLGHHPSCQGEEIGCRVVVTHERFQCISKGISWYMNCACFMVIFF